MSPTRARPVPFCRHGFLPLPLTSARFFVACVPRRTAAFAQTTDSQIRSAFTRPPNTSSRRSTAPTFSFWLFTTSSCIANLSRSFLAGSGAPPPLRTDADASPRLFLAAASAWPQALLLPLLRFLDLRHLDPFRRDRLAHDHVAGRGTRNSALDDQQMIVGIDPQHFQVANGHAAAAHPARRPHSLDDARGERRCADGPWRAVEHRTVRCGAATKMVPLDDTLKTLTAAAADDVHPFPVREDRDEHRISGFGSVAARSHLDFTTHTCRRKIRLLVVAGNGLCDLCGRLLDQPEL